MPACTQILESDCQKPSWSINRRDSLDVQSGKLCYCHEFVLEKIGEDHEGRFNVSITDRSVGSRRGSAWSLPPGLQQALVLLGREIFFDVSVSSDVLVSSELLEGDHNQFCCLKLSQSV